MPASDVKVMELLAKYEERRSPGGTPGRRRAEYGANSSPASSCEQ